MAATSVQKVKVALRLKPLKADEKAAWSAAGEGLLVALEPTSTGRETDQKHFPFGAWSAACDSGHRAHLRARSASPRPLFADHVFDTTATNETVFETVARDIVRSVPQGYNGTIFTYGQTAAGKTWTMQGDKSNPGVIRRAIDEISRAIEAVRAHDARYELRPGFLVACARARPLRRSRQTASSWSASPFWRSTATRSAIYCSPPAPR